MPIVSEHPRSALVFKRISDQYDPELEEFIRKYTERRRAYQKACDQRRAVMERLDSDDRREMNLDELIKLMDSRETAIERFRDELATIDKELMLIKREMRRARRRLIEDGPEEEIEFESRSAVSASLPEMPSVRDYVHRARNRGSWAWLKPWLRSFLPDSA